jgi:hypothetical protein
MNLNLKGASAMELQQRVTNILTKPKQEWAVIASEPTDIPTLYKEYIILLAAIPAICQFIGMTVIGVPTFLVGNVRIGFASGLVHLIVSYILTLVSVLVAAFVIEKLAPTFQSRGDLVQALKMVAYASTPVWLAGILSIYPPLTVLMLIAAIYAIYLFYLGLPAVMQTPPDKVIPYMIVSALVILVVWVVTAAVTGAVAGVGGMARF